MDIQIPGDLTIKELLQTIANCATFAGSTDKHYYLPYVFRITEDDILTMDYIRRTDDKIKERLDIK